MTTKLFFDFLSQPSRALYIFLKVTKIPFEPCPIALRTGEHLTEEFKEKNRFQKVPFIHDSGLQLAESVAIVRYLSKKHNVDSNWYPADLRAQAKVDEYLEWQHNNTRAFCALYFQRMWLIPLMTGRPTDARQLKTIKASMEAALDQIENVWLANDAFLAGPTISVADLFAACEIEQTRIADYKPEEGRPRLAAWFARVRNETNPVYEEAHAILNRIVDKNNKSKL